MAVGNKAGAEFLPYTTISGFGYNSGYSAMGVVYGQEDWAVGKWERDLEMEYNIKLEVYFEVKDSEVYGGLESVGYASTGINGCKINYAKESG